MDGVCILLRANKIISCRCGLAQLKILIEITDAILTRYLEAVRVKIHHGFHHRSIMDRSWMDCPMMWRRCGSDVTVAARRQLGAAVVVRFGVSPVGRGPARQWRRARPTELLRLFVHRYKSLAA